MSIASEISRLSSNISDSLDAVAAKGVTVPSDSNSDDLPGLIALIEQSSGGDSGGTIYQDLDGYLHLSEDDKNVISIVDTLDTAGGTIRTIDAKVETGGGLPSSMEVIDFTPTSDLTSSNKLTLNFQNSYTSCFVCVYCLEHPSAPSSGYTALAWLRFFGERAPSVASTSTAVSALLRTDGTVGTDQAMCSFNEGSLALSVGGQYGTFRAGIKYQAIKVNWGSAQ